MSNQPTSVSKRLQVTALTMAMLGFALNFWAWSLLSPLGPIFVSEGLTDDSSLLVAIPVLVGSLGRILAGAYTDRFGGRFMMTLISLLTVIPVLFIGLVGQYQLWTLLLGGFFLGFGGTSFAIGVPYVNSWFAKEQRGTAIGIYGMGMGGTAIAAFTTVPLYNINERLPFLIVAAVLVVYAIAAWTWMRNSPDWTPSKRSLGTQLADTAKIPLTWQACYLYALSFGGYVAFSVYLPTILHLAYGLETSDASLRTAGFVIAAVLMRPLGGILSDRIGAVPTLTVAYSIVIVCAIVLAFDPPLMPIGTIAFIVMSVGLGLGSGATFALIAQVSDPSKVGSITGFVGAAGGLGGFVPPLLLGVLWKSFQNYTLGIVLLAVFTVVALLITLRIGAAQKRASAAATVNS
ncbi:MFS transporter [Gulosibacter molinativorax]|uniref:NarK/NasA family nitrate transporter n=1 Tax=Gulosibacter molinativorax TaxID=256821 RepID=A0ABT7C7B7_9MICO|nr:MFS transporter [Gulosibacter molinativorax]MDJ1370561.1 NarK/NasA family nitrate transporter [Gulosibacter molinativorax]QUY62026.1 Nitrate/nitrite transporter [Gulosibacter molinativorax]